MDKRLKIGAGIAAGLGVLWAFFRPGKAAATTADGGATGNGSGVQSGVQSGVSWDGSVKTMQGKLNGLGAQLAEDGKAGTQTCRAAEKAVADGKADADIKAFAASKLCGYGLPRAPCGVTGPTAPESVRNAVLDAAVAKGYPRNDVDKAVKRESGWHASAVACGGVPKHAIAGGLLQFIPITLKAVGFDGSPDQFASLSAEKQLPYLLQFLAKMPSSTLNLPGDFGLALFTPAYVGEPDDFVIYEVGSLGWEQNPGLRSAGGGAITAGSVRATAR